MPSAPKLSAVRGRLDGLGIGAHLDAAGGVGPAEQLAHGAADMGLAQRQCAGIDSAVAAIDGEAVAGAELLVADAAGHFGGIDRERAHAGDAGLAGDAGDDRRRGWSCRRAR